jgi:phosphorylase superfamily protein
MSDQSQIRPEIGQTGSVLVRRPDSQELAGRTNGSRQRDRRCDHGGMPFPNLEGKHAGQPYVTARRLLEELAARGAEVFIGVGTAGAIDEQLAVGDPVVCSAALRDEGTSHHYAPPESFAVPDSGLTARLRAALPGAVHGPSWTTDAPYRETAEEVAKYRAEGIVTVEMEASCLFTVASAVGVRAAAAFTVSDVLHGEQWTPHFGSADILQGLWRLFEAAEGCLSG